MENPPCHVVYVSRSVGRDHLVRANRDTSSVRHVGDLGSNGGDGDGNADEDVRREIRPLLETFGDVYVCTTGSSCMTKLVELYEESYVDVLPTLVLIDTPDNPDTDEYTNRKSSQAPLPVHISPDAETRFHAPDEELYGLCLLQKVTTEAHMRGVSKFIVAVPILGGKPHSRTPGDQHTMDGATERMAPVDDVWSVSQRKRLMEKCLDLGAADVLMAPLSSKCITSLEMCTYRAHRDLWREQQALLEVRRGRKRSWVGVSDEKPFAYLREAMVSGLMNGICRTSDAADDHILNAHIAISSQRQAVIGAAVGHWHFSAHAFTDDELVVAAMLMFEHALAMPELEKWRLCTDELIRFLVACRAAYNAFVPYHNFRHVIDVLQATFDFLVHIGALPPYLKGISKSTPPAKSPIASLVTPFEALTLLITAIGHDVGHPGVNNGFLVTLNAPLAQLYNDRSVLESFHCAAYSQILRRYWPAVFQDSKMRNMMISSILATDMGLHFEYMKKLGDLQDKLQENNSIDGWNGRQTEEYRSLACSLLIKCADISNVARQHETAIQWMYILSEEFSRQASMETELQIQSSLMAPPKKDLASLAKSQLSFMNLFAIPLFQGVADIMPTMRYTVDELDLNKGLFEHRVTEAKFSELEQGQPTTWRSREGTFSPRSMSLAAGMSDNDDTATPVTQAGHQQGNDYLTAVSLDRGAKSGDAQSSKHGDQESTDQAEADGKSTPLVGHRHSEVTEDSVSGAVGYDWASHATSQATGKWAVSPSTQGTSIVSNGSTDAKYTGSHNDAQTEIATATTATAATSYTSESSRPGSMERRSDGVGDNESTSTGGSMPKGEGKLLKKRSSRFRMRDLPFFRRYTKETSPPLPGRDATTT